MSIFHGRVSRPLLVTAAALIPALLVGMAGWTHAAHGAPKAPQPPRKHKNLKILKDDAQLIPTMQAYNASLGVKCDFCHVIKPDHSGFELDEKPAKNVARSMITMTNDINAHQKVVKKQATCFMCHHGHPEPETKVPAGERPGPGK